MYMSAVRYAAFMFGTKTLHVLLTIGLCLFIAWSLLANIGSAIVVEIALGSVQEIVSRRVARPQGDLRYVLYQVPEDSAINRAGRELDASFCTCIALEGVERNRLAPFS
jgi:hypothetical protein